MIFHEKSNSLVFNAPDPFAIREAFPDSKLLPNKQYNVAVKYSLEAASQLRQFGLKAPSPILKSYKWPGKYRPFDHQRVMADFLTLHKRVFNLSEMGTGKSAASLWAADWLMSQGYVRKALILAPLSTVDRVWANDIFDVLMHRSCTIVHGSREKRLDALGYDVDFYIMNHDGVSIEPVRKAIRTNPEIDLVIVDEASMFRNGQTKKYKALREMIRPDQRLWLLTGTPCPNEPTDAWALARLVNPSRVPKYFGAFRRMTMMQVTQFKWEPRHDAYETAYNAMQPAVRFKKDECLDLPPVTTQDRETKLTKEQMDAFRAMKKAMVAEANETTITAVHAADQINKLRQILCGAVKNTEDESYEVLSHKHRLETLLEGISEASAKVIVVVPFKGIIKELEREVRKHYSVEVLNGDVPPRKRDQIIAEFKHGDDPHVLLCHPKVMAHGLNLTEADTLIFYAPIYSNDEFQQVTERFNRSGQTRKMTILRIGAHPLEWRIYKMVDGKKLTQDSILSLYKEVTG